MKKKLVYLAIGIAVLIAAYAVYVNLVGAWH